MSRVAEIVDIHVERLSLSEHIHVRTAEHGIGWDGVGLGTGGEKG